MNIESYLDPIWSLVVANVIQILIIAFLAVWIFKIRRKQSYRFYHKHIKRPLCRVNVNMKKNSKKFEPMNDQEWRIYHGSSFNDSDNSDNPFANTPLLSFEQKKKFLKRRIREIRKRIKSYYKYTDGRIKPEDLFEFVTYRSLLKTYLPDGNTVEL